MFIQIHDEISHQINRVRTFIYGFFFYVFLQPCFDPKAIEAEAAKKDDKKTLLMNVDNDLMF